MASLDELKEQIAKNAEDVKVERDVLELEMYEATVAAQTEHGATEVRAILANHGFVILKTPSQAQFRRFTDIKNPISEDMLVLVRSCLVSTKEAFNTLMDKQAGILVPCVNAALGLAGVLEKDFLEPLKR